MLILFKNSFKNSQLQCCYNVVVVVVVVVLQSDALHLDVDFVGKITLISFDAWFKFKFDLF